jgi:hypothetical protein
MTQRRVLLAKAAACTAVAVVGMLSVPTQAQADTYTDHKFSPTNGVACNEQQFLRAAMSNSSWRLICSGKPTGFSSGYKYREKIQCDGNGSPNWHYGVWKNDGTWSIPSSCPDADAILQHVHEFVFTN